MSDRNKISVVVLGKGDSLKKALITNITGTDLSQIYKSKVLTQTEIYENDTYVFICTPNLNTQCDEIREVLNRNQNYDMCLFVVEDGFSGDEVWQQIDQLSETTGKPTEEFIVVLPGRYTGVPHHPFRFCTFDWLVSELRSLAERRLQIPTNKSRADNPEPHTSTSQTPAGRTGDINLSDSFTDTDSSFPGKHAGTTVNLVLLGLTGTGKSASGNTILGEERFFSKVSSNPITTECQQAETEIGGTRVRVIDTPEIFDDEIDSSVRKRHVTKCKQLCQSDPCVYLLVMHVSRFTDGERDILKKLQKAFGSKVHNETVILFTRGNDLKREGMSLEDFLCSCQPDLKKIVETCNNRCVVFENRDSDSHQVEELMETVSEMLRTADTKQGSDPKNKSGWGSYFRSAFGTDQ